MDGEGAAAWNWEWGSGEGLWEKRRWGAYGDVVGFGLFRS